MGPSPKKTLIERLDSGVVIGDGGFVFALEKRGYLKAGPWTPECTVEFPEAVRQLHREFLRSGADVMQAFTFYASDDKLENRGNDVLSRHTGRQINQAACDLAREVADEGDALVAGGICQTPSYLSGKSKEVVQNEFQKQIDVFVENNVDFLICEYYEHIEEMEWAIEVCKRTNLPIIASMAIGPEGDLHGVTAGECAIRMADAGAIAVGVNCHFGPLQNIQALKMMKKALDAAGLTVHLMSQPVVFHVPDASKQGFTDLPEFPFALEPRIATRWEIQNWTRKCYDLGVRYIGGCCGFEPYHIRAVAEELAPERGHLPAASEKHEPWGASLRQHTKPWVRARCTRAHWEKINPSSGRPLAASMSTPEQWGVTQGDDDLVQSTDMPSEQEMNKLFEKRTEIVGGIIDNRINYEITTS